MAKIVLIFGLISGVISGVLMWILMTIVQMDGVNFDYAMIWGYATMIIALSLVFFGIKSYRDNHGGTITFLKALQVGILITLISAFCYAVTWEFYYRGGRADDFIQRYNAYYIDKMKTAGASKADIEKARVESEQFVEMYDKFYIRFPFTLIEILPVGIIVTLVSAALLRKSEMLPATN